MICLVFINISFTKRLLIVEMTITRLIGSLVIALFDTVGDESFFFGDK